MGVKTATRVSRQKEEKTRDSETEHSFLKKTAYHGVTHVVLGDLTLQY